jgi:hypothetical protein
MADWEFTFRGITFGGFQDIHVESVEGLSMPELRQESVVRAQEHGAFVTAEFLSERTITFEGRLFGSGSQATMRARELDLRTMFNPSNVDLPLTFKFANDVTKRVNCRPTRLDIPINYDFSMARGNWTGEMVAGDPRIYSDAAATLNLTPGNQGTATNSGNFPTLPIVTLTGPASSFTLENLITGESLTSTDAGFTAGETRVVNFVERTIVEGQSNKYDSLQPASTWWSINPGSNTLKFSATGTSGATLASFSYRSSWL